MLVAVLRIWVSVMTLRVRHARAITVSLSSLEVLVCAETLTAQRVLELPLHGVIDHD